MANVEFKPDTTLFGGGMQGWTCPKCGRVYSPFIHICTHCNSEITIKENNFINKSVF